MGGPLLEIPGGGGGGENSQKEIRASKQQSTNSLEKKFVQRLNALKKILQRHETEKKIRAAKILYPPSRDY